ncbi:hypothetical protein JW879_10720 [candidate division WOR-3 bacterium]|nr:hypothetical protein [candidate division WOR-3 bacterium]
MKKIAGGKKISKSEIRSTSTSFLKGFKANTKRICSILIMAICLLSIMNCEVMADILHPEPEDLEYNTHDIILHIKAINHSQDTLGVKKAVLPLCGYSYERPEISVRDNHNFFVYDFPETLYVEIPPTNAEVYIYETKIDRFIGYQEEYSGNTARYSSLDYYEGWSMELDFSEGYVVLDSGDSLISDNFSLEIPDAVKGKKLDIEITFDLKGLFHKWSGEEKLYVGNISCRQM